MLRDTMIRTMPDVMIATAADWTDRFQRLRGDRNRPPDIMLNASQRTIDGADHAEEPEVDLETGQARTRRTACGASR